MSRTSAIALGAAFLAACTSTSTPTSERHRGLVAVLEPATGITYYVPVRCVMCEETVASARAAALPTDIQTGSTLIAAVARVSQPLPLDPVQPPLPATSAPAPSAVPVHAAAVSPQLATSSNESTRPALKLDTEFASAKRLVLFAFGRASLGPVGKLAVAELVPWAQRAQKVHVTGSADSSGNARVNQELAMARAATVRSAFVAGGVNSEKISTNVCADCYVATNGTEQGRRLNRRVEVELVMQQQLIAQLPPAVHSVEAPPVPLIRAVALRAAPR